MKPVIGANGGLYPCCGTQYAEAVPSKDYSVGMFWATDGEIDDIWENQQNFDGSRCVKCYYSHYNSLLAKLIDPIDHEAFV